MTVLFFAMAICAGVFMVVQSNINGQLRVRVGDPWQAALVSTSVSTISLFVVAAISSRKPAPPIGKLLDGPWWLCTGGLLGACIVAASLFLVGKLGSGVLFALLVSGQMLAGMVMDHFGMLGLPIHHVNVQRVLGALLLLAGVALIRVF
jgi:transporter family-2 protein